MDRKSTNHHADPALGTVEGEVDPRQRRRVVPSRILWVSESGELSSVSDPELLLQKGFGQVPEGPFSQGSGCRMVNAGAPASILLDFGRELHGGVCLLSGPQSDRNLRVRIRFGESASEAMAELGERGAGNDHAIRDSVLDLPWFGSREIGNTGFSFVRLDLLSEGRLSLEALQAISLMRPMQQLGSFRCSDERLNQIFQTAVRTLHLCCQDYIWDGIKRDRLVWMGDMHPEMMTLLSVFGPQSVLTDSLDYMAATTPADAWMNNMPPYTLWWIRCLHDYLEYSGDMHYVTGKQATIRTILERLCRHISPEGRWALPSGFLDWPTQGNPEGLNAGMQALMLITLRNGVALARLLGDTELQERCQQAVTALMRWVPEPGDSKQAAALLALAGLRDARQMHDQVLGKNGVQGVSTFYGYTMLEAMAKAGEIQHGMDTIRQYWGGMLDMGATSFWEDFDLEWTRNAVRIDELPQPGKADIHGDFGDFCYKGFRHSLCHGWASGPAPWLMAHVLGVQVVERGCRTLRISPFLGDLTWAEGSFPTPLGLVQLRHERQHDGSVKTELQAPDGIQVQRQ